MRKGPWRISAAMAVLILTVNVSGCSKIGPFQEDGYKTEFPMSAVEYSVFLNQETAVLTNILLTRMSIGTSVTEEGYEASKEIASTEESIRKAKEVQDELTSTMPATTYSTDRQNILDLTGDIVDTLEDYKSALEEEDYDKIKSLVVTMKNCYVSLTGEANVNYM